MLQLPEKVPFLEKLLGIFKNLVLVSATSASVTDGGEKVVRVPYNYYAIRFQKDQEQIRALFHSSNKINTRNPVFAQKLGFYIRKTNVGA